MMYYFQIMATNEIGDFTDFEMNETNNSTTIEDRVLSTEVKHLIPQAKYKKTETLQSYKAAIINHSSYSPTQSPNRAVNQNNSKPYLLSTNRATEKSNSNNISELKE